MPHRFDQIERQGRRMTDRHISIPGVQAKISLHIVKDGLRTGHSRLETGAGPGASFIFKPPAKHFREMPENEHLSMQLAKAYGIPVVPSSLIRMASGELAYIARRIDRDPRRGKLHMLDMFQITQAFDKHKSSMEKVGQAIHLHSANPWLDKVYFFEVSLFSFLTGNNDMHLKNFSMVKKPYGWVLAPAYDLLNVALVLPEAREELALSMHGKKSKFNRADFEALGASLQLTTKQVKAAFHRMQRNRPLADDWVENSFLTREMKDAYLAVMDKRYKQLNLHHCA